jgi:hypothetical protein
VSVVVRAACAAVVAAGVLVVMSGVGGCGQTRGGPRTTVYQRGDMLEASGSIAEQLSQSGFLRGRTAVSSPIRIGLGEMRNMSNERLSDLDRRAAVAQVLIEPGMLELLAQKNVAVVLPPASAKELERFGVRGASARESDLAATHVVSAVFGSLTRAGASDGGPARTRKDVFQVDLTIVEVGSRSTVWAGRHEFARAARGVLVD